MKTILAIAVFLAVVVGAVAIPTPKTQAINPGYQTFQYVN